MAAGGWASALGEAILAANKGYQGAVDRKRAISQQDLENQLALSRDTRAQGEATDAHKSALQLAVLNQTKIDELPKEQARVDAETLMKVLGPEAAFNSPDFVRNMATSGAPIPTKPTPNFLDSVKFGSTGVKDDSRANAAADQGIAPDTGAVLPGEVQAAIAGRAAQARARQALSSGAMGSAFQKSFMYKQATGENPPAATLNDATNWTVQKLTDPLSGQQRIVRVNKATGESQSVGGGSGSGGSGSGSGGIPTGVSGDAFLQQLAKSDPRTAAVVKQLSEYKYPIGQGIGGVKMLERYGPLVATYDPTWTAGDYANRQKLAASYSSGPRSGIATSIDQVLHHMQTLKNSSDALGNVDVPVIGPEINAVKNFFVHRTDGLNDAQNLSSQAVGNELAKIYQGSGVTKEHEIQDWRQSINMGNKGPTAQKTVLQQAAELLNGALQAHRDNFQRGMGKPMNFDLISPAQQKMLESILGDAASQPGAQQGLAAQPPQGLPNGITPQVPPSMAAPQGGVSSYQQYLARQQAGKK